MPQHNRWEDYLSDLYLNARMIEVKSFTLSPTENNFSFDLRLKTQTQKEPVVAEHPFQHNSA